MSRNVNKRTFGHVRPAMIQISLRSCAVWSESPLGAVWTVNDTKLQRKGNEDSHLTARMHRLIWVFAWFLCQKVRFLTLRINYAYLLVQYNLNGSNTDGSFTVDDSNSFFSPYKILPIAQENKYLIFFFLFYRGIVCCVYSLESPHRGDSNEYTQHTIIV